MIVLPKISKTWLVPVYVLFIEWMSNYQSLKKIVITTNMLCVKNDIFFQLIYLP